MMDVREALNSGLESLRHHALRSLMVSDRAYILVDGQNARSGPAQELANDSDIRKIFLGEK